MARRSYERYSRMGEEKVIMMDLPSPEGMSSAVGRCVLIAHIDSEGGISWRSVNRRNPSPEALLAVLIPYVEDKYVPTYKSFSRTGMSGCRDIVAFLPRDAHDEFNHYLYEKKISMHISMAGKIELDRFPSYLSASELCVIADALVRAGYSPDNTGVITWEAKELPGETVYEHPFKSEE